MCRLNCLYTKEIRKRFSNEAHKTTVIEETEVDFIIFSSVLESVHYIFEEGVKKGKIFYKI